MSEQINDLIVRGRVVTMDAERSIIDDGAVVVCDGTIVAIGPWGTVERAHKAKRTMGRPGKFVLPGFIDTHTHCSQCFVRSLTTGELPMIPRIYVPAQRSLSPEQAMQTVRLIAAQLLRSGVTTLCEGTLIPAHEDAIVSTLQEVGMRANMARGAADQDFHHASLYRQITETSWVKAREGEAEKEIANTAAFLDRHPPRGRGLIRGAVNVSSLPAFSERYFREGSALARRRDTTMQVHIGRDREEVELCLAVWGRRPIERLADLGVIDEHLVAIHAVMASEGEIELLVRGKAALTHSPVECVANLNAIPNIPRFRKAGVRVGLGCDNQANDMFVTMRAAWLIHGAKWGVERYDPEFILPGELLEMATIEAAQVLRMDDLIGSLEVGKAADIVLLDGETAHLMSQHHVPSDIVRFATRAEVDATIVNGRVLYEAGSYPTIDVEQLRADSARGAEYVSGLVGNRRYKPFPHF